MKSLILLLLFFSFFNQINPQEIDIRKDTLTAKTDTNYMNLYQLLYDNSKDTNQALITTIHWIIGIMVTFFLAIVGTQIFFNYRINKQEIESIKQNIVKEFSEIKGKILLDISNEKESNRKEIKTDLEKRINDLNEKFTTYFSDKSKIIDAYNDVNQKTIQQINAALESKTKALQIDINKNTGDIWILKGVKVNAISNFSRTAILQKEMNYEMKYTLDNIIEVLKDLNEIHEGDYKELDKLIQEIPEKYSDKKVQIENGYKNKPIYKFVESATTELGLDFTKIYLKK